MNFAKMIMGATLLLCGCSEMRTIGAAAMRELRADAVPVNWKKTVEQPRVNQGEHYASSRFEPARPLYFSTYRTNLASSKTAKPAVKGLWEQGSGRKTPG